MAAEAEASREAKAKVIAAEGELKSSEMLKQASDIMTQSTVAVQVHIYFILIYTGNKMPKIKIFALVSNRSKFILTAIKTC